MSMDMTQIASARTPALSETAMRQQLLGRALATGFWVAFVALTWLATRALF